ncbi:MAG: translocation/assembly module TamB domain-containing protein [Flavobacteriaceae bacterium]|jgi:hypothetical protein|nr:translocation/assembly module TamB domain-containing protein [Flavobacteriaceae bacterium]
MLLFLLSIVVFSIPSVQTRLGTYATTKVNKTYGTDIRIEKAGLRFNGDVALKNILIKDHHEETLISVAELNTSIISFAKIAENKLTFGAIDLFGFYFNIKKYSGENDTNLDIFVDKFDRDNQRTKTSDFLLSSSTVTVHTSNFSYVDENLNTPLILDLHQLNLQALDFLILGKNITASITALNFKDSRGATLKNLQTNFSYSLTQMKFDELKIKSKNSLIVGTLQFDYNRADFEDFSNKVKVSGFFKNSNLDLEELNVFYNEFGSFQKAVLNTAFSGTLNNLFFDTFNLKTSRNTSVNGKLKFKNLFNSTVNSFEMDADFKSISSTYTDLKAVLPRVLGASISSSFEALGRFDIQGTAKVSKQTIETVMDIETELGALFVDLNLDQIESLDNALYVGQVQFTDFDMGRFIKEPKMGLISSNLNVEGRGFNKETINSNIKGKFDSFTFQNYIYSDLEVSGVVKNKIFNGQLNITDPNLEFSFEGLVDFSENENIYDFSATIPHANLNALNFVKRDRISVLNGQVIMDMRGTSIDDVYGTIKFKNTLYQNQNDSYNFKDFEITSSFDANSERTIRVNSPEIVQGNLKGKFAIKEVPNLLRNAFGDIYTKYKPYQVNDSQYFNFNFKIYNKIVEIFSSQLKLGSNTFTKGRVESDPKNFKLTFRSPNIKLEDFFARQIEVQLINDNPLFNSYIEVDSLATPFYNASKFSLINVTLNDTLYVKSEFNGGKNSSDKFDLNLFYTIDDADKSVVGIKKSYANFKNTPWLINGAQDKQNKIVFDRAFEEVIFDNINMSYENEEVLLNAAIQGTQNKNITVEFKNVDLAKVTPEIKNLKLGGNLNGQLNISQLESVYLPKSNLTIDNLALNDFNLGSFKAAIKGNQSLTNYDVNIALKEGDVESLSVVGLLDVSGENSELNLDINFDDLILNPLNPFGTDVITNIRGDISGFANVSGRLEKPQIEGRLTLNNGGLAIPYLNVDYEFVNNSTIKLREQSFIFEQALMVDTDYQSQALLDGSISHNNFSNWSLDLNFESDRLLVLNTDEQDESIYYGTAFVDGSIDITGPTDQLFIEANVSTSEGTVFKIPLNDNEILAENSYIHFLSPKEKSIQNSGQPLLEQDDIKGLEMAFNMDVNDNAEIEIVLDKNTGSSILGRGNGSMLAQINTKGKFQMFGDFIVLSGIYNFSFGRIIQKKFKVVKDGTLGWDGNPLSADINIKALYDGISVNPSTLLDNPINQSIPAEVEIHLTGQLEQPNLDFDVRFPSVNSTLNSELSDRLRDKDRRQFQALSLLATGAFRSELTLGSQDAFGIVSDGVTNILNELFADDDNKVKLGIDVDLGETTPEYESDSRVGVTVSTKLSENVLINGKVGVPVGGVSETTVAGDFEVEVLLNEDRTLSLKFFNRENSIQNFGEQIGYTQGVGLSYNIEFDNLKELFEELFKNKNKITKTESLLNETRTDLPNYINFK